MEGGRRGRVGECKLRRLCNGGREEGEGESPCIDLMRKQSALLQIYIYIYSIKVRTPHSSQRLKASRAGGGGEKI